MTFARNRFRLGMLAGILIIGFAALISLPSRSYQNTSAVPASIPGVIPANFFGIHLGVSNSSLSDPAPWGTPILAPLIVGALAKCVASSWQYAERTPGVYTWAQIDRCTAWAAHFGVRYFQSWEYMTPASIGATDPATDSRCWPAAVSGIYSCMGVMTPQGRQQWIQFNTALALRFKGHPGMGFYEGWNEPPYAPQDQIPPITASQLAEYERDRVTAIRSNDPNAKVGSPAFILDPRHPSYSIFLDAFLSNNPPVYDSYDFHADYQNQPEDEIPTITQFRQVLAKHGVASPVIFATEAGRGGFGAGVSSIDTCPAWPKNVTMQMQEAFVARMELIYWSQGVSRHYWYAYDTCGTLSNQPLSNTLTAAGSAYSIVENWMIGATMSRPCALDPSGSSTWTCTLTRDGGYQAIVVWSTAGRDLWTLPSGSLRYRDLDGYIVPVSGGTTIWISAKPILIENQ